MSTTIILPDHSRIEIAFPGHRPRLIAGSIIGYIERPGTDWDLYAGNASTMPNRSTIVSGTADF